MSKEQLARTRAAGVLVAGIALAVQKAEIVRDTALHAALERLIGEMVARSESVSEAEFEEPFVTGTVGAHEVEELVLGPVLAAQVRLDSLRELREAVAPRHARLAAGIDDRLADLARVHAPELAAAAGVTLEEGAA